MIQVEDFRFVLCGNFASNNLVIFSSVVENGN